MQIEELTTAAAYEEWNSFLRSTPGGTIYHSSQWVEINNALAVPGQMMRIICCRSKTSGEIVGGCTFLDKRKYGFRLAVNPILTQYAGFVLSAPDASKLSDSITRNHYALSLMAAFLRKHFHEISLYSAPGVYDLRPLQQKKWLVSPAYTYFLKLDNTEFLWEQFDGSVRRQIKKGEKQGYDIITEMSESDIQPLIDATFHRRHQQNPISMRLVGHIIADQRLQEHRFIIAARDQAGKVVSAIIALVDDKRAYYTLSATIDSAVGSGVQSWLLWSLFTVLHDKGIREFDFLGANIPSIARFKEKFNPETIHYFSAIRRNSHSLRLLKAIRKVIKS